MTRIARGKIELRRERLDLREVVGRAAEDFRFKLDEGGVGLRLQLPGAAAWVDADPTRLAQVVDNLLHNASKFTRRDDEVVLSLEAVGSEAELRVRDTGEGIEPDLLPHVFDVFVQSDQSLARPLGGLGLGLALLKGIVTLHGGSVRAHSGGRGQGAEFVIRLPLAPAAPAAQQATEEAVYEAGGVRRVLIVDDNRDAAESLADVVRMLGHTAEVALDGPAALARVRTLAPDVVLCDIGLPGMSGYDVARELRAQGRGMQLYAVSGYAQPEDVRRALEAGFDAHVAKPPDLALVQRLLGPARRAS
jgi:CheY-like chemotaxis protein